MTETVEVARAALGKVGVYVPGPMTSPPSIAGQVEAARRFEGAGYGSVWVNETVGGKDPLVQLALLLSATERVVAGTGIANIWARAAQVAHGGAAMLAEAFPGRVVLGLGVGYPQQAEMVGREYGSPAGAMTAYLEAMHAPTMPPAPTAAYPRIVAANGPKMLALAAEKADGAYPAGGSPEHTAQARQILGPHKLLVVGLTVLGGQDAGELAAQLHEHREAGADHVVLLPSLTSERPPTVEELVALAPALV